MAEMHTSAAAAVARCLISVVFRRSRPGMKCTHSIMEPPTQWSWLHAKILLQDDDIMSRTNGSVETETIRRGNISSVVPALLSCLPNRILFSRVDRLLMTRATERSSRAAVRAADQ